MKSVLSFILTIFFFIIVLFSSCEKDITVDLPEATSKVVVDGYVETGQPVYVILSRNAAYFAPIDPNTVNIFETGAAVIVNNGTIDDTLTELTQFMGLDLRGVYISTHMIGEVNKQYTLTVSTTRAEHLSAVTNLPQPVPLDSVWFKIQETIPDNDSLGYLWATLHDPDTLNNCYRWLVKRVDKDSSFLPPIGSSFDDKFFNGTTFDFAYNRASVFNSTAPDDNNDEAGFYKKGDSIIVKWCAVSRSTYEFWRDAETQVSNNGSPFASPSAIKSNVNGGLGLFAAYSPTYYKFRAK